MERIAALAIFLTLPTVSALAQETWTVEAERAACLIENLDGYLDHSDGDPIIVVLPACPEADPSIALGMMQQNSGAQPSVTVLPDNTSVDEIIFFSREEISCLRAIQIDLSAETTAIPLHPCD